MCLEICQIDDRADRKYRCQAEVNRPDFAGGSKVSDVSKDQDQSYILTAHDAHG